MKTETSVKPVKLSIVIPCFNEEKTLEKCLRRVLAISDDNLSLEIIVVDDCSNDNSIAILEKMEKTHPEIVFCRHEKNQGKGAALQTGFRYAKGDIVAIQDADLEYNPQDLKRLIVPIVEDEADVVFGSRFLSGSAHRVLYFWHSLGNRFLTLLSNMFSDLNLSDMECCYKVFRTRILKEITIEENRFGIEPELVAKIAQLRPRIFEMGISYSGRTYAEGKKIGIKDGFRALYCIFHYNMPKAPFPVQFVVYSLIGGTAALANILAFLILLRTGVDSAMAIPSAFLISTLINYLLSTRLIFRRNAKWKSRAELIIYAVFGLIAGGLDYMVTVFLLQSGYTPLISKSISCGFGWTYNYLIRRFFIFPELPVGEWRPQADSYRGSSDKSE